MDVKVWFSSVARIADASQAMEVGEELRRPIEDLDEEARDMLFGRKGRV